MFRKGFFFALGASIAVALVVGAIQYLDFYGKCARTIDAYGAPPAGHACEWVAAMHPPKVADAGL